MSAEDDLTGDGMSASTDVVLTLDRADAIDLRRVLVQACAGGVALRQEARTSALRLVDRLEQQIPGGTP